jgi:hypothetical protein
MARSQSQKLSSSARSEIERDWSKVYGTKEWRKKEREIENNVDAYKANWNEKTEYKPKDIKFGDGQIGNGLIKDGKLFLREEDIKKIVAENQGEGSFTGSKKLQSAIFDNEGFKMYGLDLFVGENNKGNEGFKQDTLYTDAFRGDTQEDMYPDLENEEMEYVSARVNVDKLIVDYENVMGNGIKMDRESAENLAEAFQDDFREYQAFVAKEIEPYDYEEERRKEMISSEQHQADFLRRERRDRDAGY